MRARRRDTWSSSPRCRSRPASSIRTHPLANRRRPSAPTEDKPEPTTPEPAPAAPASASGGLSFANSDLAFQGEHLFIGNFNGFNTYDIEDPKKARLIASVVCPGGQGDVSVHGNLLVMSVEADARPAGLRDAGGGNAGQRRTLPRRPDLRHQRHAQAAPGRGRADLPRIAHAHARHRAERQGEPVRLRIGDERGALGRGARRLFEQGSERGPEHRALQHRRHPDSAGSAGEGRGSSTARGSSPTRRPATLRDCGRVATRGRERRRRA